MEYNNYRSVTPLRKKRKKITMAAALILCLVFFVVGIACGRTATSSKQEKEANQKIQQLEKKGELAKLKKEVAEQEKAAEENIEPAATETIETESATEDKSEEEKKAPKEKSSNNLLRNLIIICLVVIIIICILFALSILIRRNDDDDDYDDEEDEEEYIEEYETYEDDETEE